MDIMANQHGIRSTIVFYTVFTDFILTDVPYRDVRDTHQAIGPELEERKERNESNRPEKKAARRSRRICSIFGLRSVG